MSLHVIMTPRMSSGGCGLTQQVPRLLRRDSESAILTRQRDNSRNTSVAELMHSLTLPSLESLEIKEDGAGYISALEQLLIRSELPPLRTLALYGPESNWGDTWPYPRPSLPHLASCLRQIPLLIHLTLQSSVSCPDPANPTDPIPVLESMFQALTGTSTSRPACPNLDKLTMVRSFHGILRDQSFLDFLEQMIIIAPTGKAPLKTVEIQVLDIDAPRSRDDQTEALVERLKRAGIEIVFSGCEPYCPAAPFIVTSENS
ncbi:hypothetical protein C8J56DRAFT_884370 [Mycena floridula]|nr:hypothetical protein C8J56DRAFT_884370 [Mycena floridula]